MALHHWPKAARDPLKKSEIKLTESIHRITVTLKIERLTALSTIITSVYTFLSPPPGT